MLLYNNREPHHKVPYLNWLLQYHQNIHQYFILHDSSVFLLIILQFNQTLFGHTQMNFQEYNLLLILTFL
jgi:hypothetical protein